MQVSAVEPDQEGSLWAQRTNAWNVLAAVIFYKSDVVFYVGKHLLSPFLTLAESSDGGDRSEEGWLIQFVGAQPRIEFPADFFVWNDGVAAYDSCNVEGLGRSLEGDADVARLVGNRSKWNVLVSKQSHVCMNLIADNEQMMFVAEVGKSLQGFLAPGNTARIMRIAENQDLALLIIDFLQIFEIHLVISILLHLQWIEDHLSAVTLWSEAEWVINGWLDDDFLIRTGEDIHHESDTFYNTWNEADPLSLYIPLVVVMHPVDDAGQIIFRLHGVAEKRVFQSCLEGICNKRWGLEIHIGYPEWQQIISSPAGQQGAMLQVVAARTVYDFIEIVHVFTLNFEH